VKQNQAPSLAQGLDLPLVFKAIVVFQCRFMIRLETLPYGRPYGNLGIMTTLIHLKQKLGQ